MSNRRRKQLSNSFSTGGGGGHFEAHVQASFVTLMLTGGYAPCMPRWPIVEIKLQSKIDGVETDDVLVTVEDAISRQQRRLLVQIKHRVRINKSDAEFGASIEAAWYDFNNPRVFTRGQDAIALICGPLSATDTDNVLWLLNHAKHTTDAAEFFRNVERFNFSPPKSEEKLEAIRHYLNQANEGQVVSNEDVYAFLNHFHLLSYDLGGEGGVVLSLLESHISLFNPQDARHLWSRIVDLVQSSNQNAGTLRLATLPGDLRDAFSRSGVIRIPAELTQINRVLATTDWIRIDLTRTLAVVNLVGAWDEKREADLALLSRITGDSYPTLAKKLQQTLIADESPISLQNGNWTLAQRAVLWKDLGAQIVDQDLDAFRSGAVSVLKERNPAFDLPAKERFAASVSGKINKHSKSLRSGLAEGLALLGCRPDALVNCSRGKSEETAVLTIRQVFEGADWVLWGSLNDLLPNLAEAAPNEFLDAFENALNTTPNPFDELFRQEGDGITGGSYLTGVLWALEGLAWDENYLVRVCVALGQLASQDPGGRWANRPSNSLTSILLPWSPGTLAPIAKRKVALTTLARECPEATWRLILSLLPSGHQMSTGTHRPSWRLAVPEGWGKEVRQSEYWEQVSSYAELAISIAASDIDKLADLIGRFDNLPKPCFDRLLTVLSSTEIVGLSEDERRPIWERLTKFANHHRRFHYTEWALSSDLIEQIESAANRLAPSAPMIVHQPLFNGHDSDLYEENGNWEEQSKTLDERRRAAINEIVQIGGASSALKFAESVDNPDQVGLALGYVGNGEIDANLLPHLLDSQNFKHVSFLRGFVWGRRAARGWDWTDSVDKVGWSDSHLGKFLGYLPFTNKTWERATIWLQERESAYWGLAVANPYMAEGSLDVAVDKLIAHGRPNAAINCLDRMRHDKQDINTDRCIKALISAVSSTEPANSLDAHHTIDLIQYLQSNAEVDPEDLFHIEWAYLSLLQGYNNASPTHLEHRLAGNPDFFCEVIRLVYRSTKQTASEVKHTEAEKAIATNAWRLLNGWHITPGTQADGTFNEGEFDSWITRVKEISNETGHLEVAMINVGEVLIHTPPDKDGLWINRRVATAMNESDAGSLRDGFRTGIWNSRGAHVVDPTGAPELELANKYKDMGDAAENAGYQRLAVTLRSLQDSYLREATRIIEENKRRGS
jgi:hypothetical protein